ncbi:MAG: hypothetical protein M1536_02275 [Firmicutes bacterium]|nr:hypothetical protein [Bacillota bacterium]
MFKGEFKIFIKVIKLLLVAAAVFFAMYFIPLPYYITGPGTTRDLSSVVTVEGGKKHTGGKFILTTVFYQKANLFLWLYSLADRKSELRKKENEPWQRIEDYENYMIRQMEESKYLAAVAALNEKGYNIKINRQGIRVEAIFTESKAMGVLKPGDLILELNGNVPASSRELSMTVNSLPPGAVVKIKIRRFQPGSEQGKEMEFSIPTIQREGRTVIGILLGPSVIMGELPVKVTIDSGHISGSSAGLMFALEILSQLEDKDLAKGYAVAGTGTIDEDGNVGPIEGAKFKIIAAERAGAKIFLVPQENYEEAKSAGTSLKILPVKTLHDAVNALANL